jgi:hypothetical protein
MIPRREMREGSGKTRRRQKRDEIVSNRHRALAFRLSMILSENRYILFRIMR